MPAKLWGACWGAALPAGLAGRSPPCWAGRLSCRAGRSSPCRTVSFSSFFLKRCHARMEANLPWSILRRLFCDCSSLSSESSVKYPVWQSVQVLQRQLRQDEGIYIPSADSWALRDRMAWRVDCLRSGVPASVVELLSVVSGLSCRARLFLATVLCISACSVGCSVGCSGGSRFSDRC